MKFDLFRLYVPNEDTGARSQISCTGKELNSAINLILRDMINKGDKIYHICKRISSKLNYHPSTVLKMLRNRNEQVSIVLLVELLNEWKNVCNKSFLECENLKLKIQSDIEWLYCGSKFRNMIKAIKKVDINLAKIIGAHHADGCLTKEKSKGGMNYKFMILDYYKSNLIAFNKWMIKTFGVQYRIKKDRSNAWIICFRNKIIGRYLEIFFGFPGGNKSLFNLPEIIKESTDDIKKAYVLGFLTFDGCVETDRTVSLGIKNKILRDEIKNILPKSFDIVKKEGKDQYGVKTGVLSKKEIKAWKNFFESGTEKWFKLNDYLYGFKRSVDSEEEAIEILNKIFPKQNSSNISLKKVITVLKELKYCDKFYLAKQLNIGVSTLFRYLHILDMSRIIIRTNNTEIFPKIGEEQDAKLILSKSLHNLLFFNIESKYTIKDICNKLNILKATYRNWKAKRHGISFSKFTTLNRMLNMNVNPLDIKFNKKIFKFNDNYQEWVVPDRPWF